MQDHTENFIDIDNLLKKGENTPAILKLLTACADYRDLCFNKGITRTHMRLDFG